RFQQRVSFRVAVHIRQYGYQLLVAAMPEDEVEEGMLWKARVGALFVESGQVLSIKQLAALEFQAQPRLLVEADGEFACVAIRAAAFQPAFQHRGDLPH